MSIPVKITIADDHTLFLDGICSMLQQENNLQVINTAADGKELLTLLDIEQPDIVILDINISGLEVTKQIKQRYPCTQVIILSSYNEPHLASQARNNGASGYLLKNCRKDDLIHAIHLVVAGGFSFPGNTSYTDTTFLKMYHLTKREMEIVELISRQYTNQQIADLLYLSIYTIETHRKNIMQKLQLKTPAALIRFILTNPCHSVIFGFYCLVLLS
ncbi:two component transcriptional regulator, LuxR family [Chitinophaga sp. CF118]|uniref:response regulator n=1 Tax=Chitinophaga sp. CF118 TaxID=1884367 RepID=UPI0008E33D94|nr:response regulator transcription factor [Chitinophaga sp. CF118]SFD63917.1 two component transcriptional regulator, LuxR family [Chitinophaga sp. CF118]